MITGHEEHTFELNEEELELAERLIVHFKRKTKKKPVKAKEIVDGVNNTYELKNKFTDVRLRKIVNYYRTNSILPIISSKHGYYVSYDKQDIEDMFKSLNQRASSILASSLGLLKILQIQENTFKEVQNKNIKY